MATFFGPAGFESGSFDEFLARFFGAGGGASDSRRRIDLTELMTEPTQRLLGAAARYAGARGQTEIDPLHLLHAIAEQEPTRELIGHTGADPDKLAGAVERELPPVAERPAEASQPTLAAATKRVLLDAHQAARALGSMYIAPEHVLLALAANQSTRAGNLLDGAGVSPRALQSPQEQGASAGTGASGTPTLDKYGQDLTKRAADGELDPVVGRAEEIEQTIEVLSRRTKNNPVLVGDAGVGKTAIVEGIAARIVAGEVPDTLANKRLVQLDLSGMLAGTRYRGDFEERMTKVIEEISAHSAEVIVFIDELHTVVNAGGAEGSVDAGNMLKPRLARGDLHVIGATTLGEYRKHVEADPALERRFQPVQVPEPSVPDTVAVLRGLRERYAEHHKVHYTDEAITAAAELADRYIADRFLPDKAIDLIDQAGARRRLRLPSADPEIGRLRKRLESLAAEKDQAVAQERFEDASRSRDEINALRDQLSERGVAPDSGADVETPEVTARDIAEVVSRRTGVPVSQLTESEKVRLRKLEDELHQRVIGQDTAVHAVARAVRRSRSGMGDERRPVGSFLFLGPTGVGKTELAKALAETLFGDEERMVRLDMSEFGERHTASRLVGAPPGYVGYGEAGELTEAVRRRPYTVVLLDEVEKAHPDVFNTLLQVLEDGRLTDGQGRTVDFSNAVLIMTSNIGSELISSKSGPIGFNSAQRADDERSLRERLMPRLRESFRPEFLNRIDEIVTFRRLAADELHTITDLLLADTRKRLSAQRIEVEFDASAVDWLAEHGHQPEFGARPLRRTIQRQVDDHIADLLLDGELSEGAALRIGVAEDALTFEVRQQTAAA
ncbi:ATP-dependent Clp protease ATP-binding subunit ClpC [Tamaricihabitans halophyticus]|uniref:ATP-dependent Clp protease ATP-binding subunit ClpC n=1 Tax=Tamaricihabitans halophyticus TaxID=1262583 RepID=A0A4R2R050_9PSEU|nr:ATP-dependent Clp protease ATP-binding subunit [Tamaricihabitans halophyticus]TCP55044.1 ATP-dependent Clp protease ATP-binding subunit ClpC [Tamaricihabitans halophyticus]